jgi:hypothetical protein
VRSVDVAWWKREDVTAQTVAPGSRRQWLRLMEHDLCAPSTNRQPFGGVAGKPAVNRVAEQSRVFEDDEQRVRSARHHLAGFLSARARVEFAVGVAGGRQEMVGVRNGEVTPQPEGQTHAVNELIVIDHVAIADHAKTIPEPESTAVRRAAADRGQAGARTAQMSRAPGNHSSSIHGAWRARRARPRA